MDLNDFNSIHLNVIFQLSNYAKAKKMGYLNCLFEVLIILPLNNYIAMVKEVFQ